METQDVQTLWTRFVAAVYDSLGRGAAYDVVSLHALCEKLWPSFTSQIADGTLTTGDFAKLMVAKRALFQTEDMLVDSVVAPLAQSTPASSPNFSDLPYYSKYLLCAAYLASYNSARQDSLFFMRSTDRKRRRRGGGGDGGGGAVAKTNGSNLAAASHAGRQAKNRKIPRRLLGPGSFPLERLLAIFHSILPHAVAPTADLGTQIATLATLRLLVRSGIGGGGGGADALDASAKWKVNVGWDYVVALARGAGFEITEYVME